MNTNKRKDIEEITFVKQVVLEEISPKRAKTHASKIYDELAKRKCEELLSWMRDGKLIYLKSTDSIYNALHLLKDNKILGAPVLSEKDKHYIGFVDMVDLVTAAVDVCEACGTFDKPALTAGQDEELDVGDFEEQMIMNALSTTSVVDLSERNPFVCVKTDDSAVKAASYLIGGHHRVGVINSSNELVGLITQSGLLEFITEELATLYSKISTSTKVSDLKLPTEVYSVTEDDKAIDAFKLMRDKQVSGLAVISNGDILQDVISVRDLMLWNEWIAAGVSIQFTNLYLLRYSVKEFLETSRAQRPTDQVVPKFPVVCKSTSTLETVVGDMQLNNIHRLFVVGESSILESVITFKEVLEALLL